MYAIIKTGGKQYKVSEGDLVRVEKLNAEVGESVSFEDVLLVKSDSDLKVGTPKVENAKVELEEYRQDAEVATVQIKGRYAARFASAMQHFVEEISSGYSQKEADYSKMLEQLMELEREIKQKEEEIVGCKNNILGFEKKRDDAKGTFEEYDSKYQSIQFELDQLKEQIAELNEWK